MGSMGKFSRITIRLKPHEEILFGRLIVDVRRRTGYPIPATEVVKNLMGFETRLAPLNDADRDLLRQDRKLSRA
jgi:hypothetical protein